jgi:hypothetical protein
MKLAAALALTLFATVAIAETVPAPQSFPVMLTYQEWAQVVGAVRRSDTLSARGADDIVNKIAQQVAADQKQGAAQAPVKK